MSKESTTVPSKQAEMNTSSSFSLINISRKLYSHGDDFLNKRLFTDESLNSPEKTIFSKSERWNIFMVSTYNSYKRLLFLLKGFL